MTVTSSPSATNTNKKSNSNSSKNRNIGIGVGVGVGVPVVLGALGALYYFYKRRSNTQAPPSLDDEDSDPFDQNVSKIHANQAANF